MTHKLTSGSHVLSVETLARVEGEGGMHVHVQDGEVLDVHLRIFEPPRFFEAFLRGRSYTEPPDITARICGICPVAYQMSACLAIEDAARGGRARRDPALRRLLYCGEWIESHALHIFMLHAPDLLGYDGAIEMARDHRELVESALRIKRAGNDLMTVVGGRSVHPVNVRVGGFHRLPRREELLALRPALVAARRRRSPRCRSCPASSSPTSSSPTCTSRWTRRTATRWSPARWSPPLACRLRSRSSVRTSPRSTSRTRTPCTPPSTVDRTSSARWPATP